jgi:phosphatidylserine/phosphatidylglycerophosphate/cardiolipin synthase-like enzyme
LLALPLLSACSWFRQIPVLPAETSTETFYSQVQVGTRNEWDKACRLSQEDGRNRVAIINHGEQALELRINLIRSAQRSIKIQTFMWGDDETGRLLMWELIRAVKQRGVHVQIIADQMFSDVEAEILADLASMDPRMEIRLHNPNALRMNPDRIDALTTVAVNFDKMNRRMHDKVFIADDRIVVAGGRNYFNEYYDKSIGLNYKDRDLLFLGPVVTDVVNSFMGFWDSKWVIPAAQLMDVATVLEEDEFVRASNRSQFAFYHFFDKLDRRASDRNYVRENFVEALQDVDRVEWLHDHPTKRYEEKEEWHGTIAQRWGEVLGEAKSSILIQSPYLVLSDNAIARFTEIREKNPDLRIDISTNSMAATDNWQSYGGSMSQRRVFLEDLRLNIHEFKPIPQDIHLMLNDYQTLLDRKPTPAELEGLEDTAFKIDPGLAPYPIPADEEGNNTSNRRLNRFTETAPYMCMHGKSMVIDEKIAFIGSFNLDPRSEALNTEIGLLIFDEDIAKELRANIERDIRPENSFIVGIREQPLVIGFFTDLLARMLEYSPIDPWPLRYSSSFELRPGKEPVPLGHEDFYDNWEDRGAFPLMPYFSSRSNYVRIFRAMGKPLRPLL